jgi:hypothetical protein
LRRARSNRCPLNTKSPYRDATLLIKTNEARFVNGSVLGRRIGPSSGDCGSHSRGQLLDEHGQAANLGRRDGQALADIVMGVTGPRDRSLARLLVKTTL